MKRTLTKTLLVAAVAFLTSLTAFAYDGSKLVDASTYAELKAKGNIQKSYYKKSNVTLSLVPDTELAKKAAKFWPRGFASTHNPLFWSGPRLPEAFARNPKPSDRIYL